jgi:hypothetical protein
MTTRLFLSILCLSAGLARATDATWLGGPGNYTDATNWDIGVVPLNGSPQPADSYDVIVGGGSLTLNASVAVNSFSLSNARLDVAGSQTLSAATTFGAGAVIGGETLNLTGASAASAVDSDLYLNLDSGAQISNSGTFTHAATGAGATAIVLNANSGATGSVFRNTASGTFNANASATDASIGYGAANAGNLFLNSGVFNKTGAHDYAANIAFQNAGVVNVQQGALHLNGGDGGTTTGSYALGNGATLAVGSTMHFASGASVSGGGTFQMKSGAADFASGTSMTASHLQVLSGTMKFLTGSTLGSTALAMSGGTLQLDIGHTFDAASFSASGRIAGSGHVTFSGTTALGTGSYVFGGSGLKEFAGTATFASNDVDQFFNVEGGAEVRNTGSFTQSRLGSGDNGIVLNADSTGGSSIFRNATAGTFTANMSGGDGGVGFAAASAGNRFVNEGAFVKTGSGVYAFNVALTNNGTAAVQQGVVNVNAGGTAAGSFTISSGATLGLNGTFDVQSGGSVGGKGTVKLNGGVTTFLSGSSFTASNLQILSGTMAFRSGSTLGSAALSTSGGILELDIDHSFTNAALGTGSTISGAGATTFGGTTAMNGATVSFSGSGTRGFSGTATFTSGGTDSFLNIAGGAEVRNTGAFTQTREGSGQNQIVLNSDLAGGASVFRNAGGATFTAAMTGGDGSVGAGAASSGNAFLNEGTFTKTGARDYLVSVAFANSGTVNVQGGGLKLLAGDGGSTSGSLAIQSGASTTLGGGFSFGSGASVSGSGTFLSSGGTTTFGNGSSFSASALQASGGKVVFGAGSTLGATALTLAGATLQMDIGHTFASPSLGAGATVSGSGATIFQGPTGMNGVSVSFAGSGVKTFSGLTTFTSGSADSFLNVAGGAEVRNTGTFTQTRNSTGLNGLVLNSDLAGGASVFRNAAGATFTAVTTGGDGGVGAGEASSGNTFINQGSFVKTGSADYVVSVAFANSGSVNVQQGGLELLAGDGGSTSGSLAIQSGASATLGGGFSLASGATVSGAGTFISSGGTTTFGSGSSFTAAALQITGGTTVFGAGSTIGTTALSLGAGTLQLDIGHTFTSAAFSNGATVTGSGAATFDGTVAMNASTVTISGAGVKTFAGTTTFASGSADSYLNITGGSELSNTGTFTQTRGGAGASAIVLASNGSGTSVFRNSGAFVANVSSGIATMGYGVLSAQNQFINSGSLTKNGAGVYQVNVAIDNSGSIHVAQGTLSATAGVKNAAGTITTDAGTAFDLSENVHASTTGALTHNGAMLSLGANSITVASDYQNANFGSGNAFNGRARVSGSGQILAAGDTALAYAGNAASGAIDFGTVHVGDVVSASYSVKNAGTAASVRGAFQTVGNGANVTDSRLSGTGIAAADFGKLDAGATSASRTITFSATNAGALSGQQIHVATNFDNVTLANLTIQGAANYYASPLWTNATGDAVLSKLSATSYTLSFGTVDVSAGLLAADLDLLNELLDAFYQDSLGGTFNLADVTHFTLTGFDGFSGVGSGDSRSGFAIQFDPSDVGSGTYSETLMLNPTSTNGSGSSSLSAIQLTIQAAVVPEPSVLALVLAGLGLAFALAKCPRKSE